MKKILGISLLFILSFHCNAQPIVSDDGHPEHIVAGAIVGGGVSYLVYRKTGNKFKSWLIGAATATAVGYLKEAIDPSLGNIKSDKDFGYSALGGVIGAGIVFPLKRRKPREKPNIATAFRNDPYPELKSLVVEER